MRILLTLPVLLAWSLSLHGQTRTPAPAEKYQPGGLVPPGGAKLIAPTLKPPAFGADTAATQKAPTVASVPPAKNLDAFDPKDVQVRWVNGHWELQAGKVWFRDFGHKNREAQDALNVIRRLNLTQRGAIGRPLPIMEYWLADGKAPRAFGSGLRLTPIDRPSLRVEEIQGHWCVRDDRRILFNFGSLQEDARQALAVIQGYNFHQIGYVGYPNPSMIYFVTSANGTGTGSSIKAPSINIKPIPNADKGSPKPAASLSGNQKDDVPVNPLLIQQAQLMARGINQLAAPPVGGVTQVRFDVREVAVRRDRQEWKLFAGQHELARFGPNANEARAALQLLQHYGCNEHCLIGLPEPTFSYFLANGRPPVGMHHQLNGRSFDPDRVAAQQIQNRWYVCDNGKPLVYFGDHDAEAQETARAIQKYRFDFISQLGPKDQPAMTLLIRTK